MEDPLHFTGTLEESANKLWGCHFAVPQAVALTLTPGKLRTLLYIVDRVKNSDARIQRSFAIIEHLKANGGKINYRQLNEALKALAAE